MESAGESRDSDTADSAVCPLQELLNGITDENLHEEVVRILR